MQSVRHARSRASLVLAWFVLALGIAVIAPVVHPQSIELLCSGTGIKLLVHHDDGSPAKTQHTLDCPLCAAVGAPPPTASVSIALPLPIGPAKQPIPATRLAVPAFAPMPARGPPFAIPT
jgi:hypothetical protein